MKGTIQASVSKSVFLKHYTVCFHWCTELAGGLVQFYTEQDHFKVTCKAGNWKY